MYTINEYAEFFDITVGHARKHLKQLDCGKTKLQKLPGKIRFTPIEFAIWLAENENSNVPVNEGMEGRVFSNGAEAGAIEKGRYKDGILSGRVTEGDAKGL